VFGLPGGMEEVIDRYSTDTLPIPPTFATVGHDQQVGVQSTLDLAPQGWSKEHDDRNVHSRGHARKNGKQKLLHNQETFRFILHWDPPLISGFKPNTLYRPSSMLSHKLDR